MMRAHPLWWGVLLIAALVPGCGGKGGLVKTIGVVRLDDQPLNGATVEFHPAASDGQYARAMTDSDGTFRLQTDGNDGAMPGTYRVTVNKFAPSREKLKESVLPRIYTSKKDTPFQITVPYDGPVALDLKSESQP
jgi:hypothetical protein